MLEVFPNVNPTSTIRIRETATVPRMPTVYSPTIVTKLANPSFTPGTGIGMGIMASK